jgi:NAD-dependent oxidoreductase involved in siderophore biosynthesis
VFVTPQSENSQGTKQEVELAESLGIPVFDNIDDLVKAFSQNQ